MKNRISVAVDGDRGSLGGQYAGFADFKQGKDQQGNASDHEDHGDGRGPENAHAADADTEGGDERKYDHEE